MSDALTFRSGWSWRGASIASTPATPSSAGTLARGARTVVTEPASVWILAPRAARSELRMSPRTRSAILSLAETAAASVSAVAPARARCTSIRATMGSRRGSSAARSIAPAPGDGVRAAAEDVMHHPLPRAVTETARKNRAKCFRLRNNGPKYEGCSWAQRPEGDAAGSSLSDRSKNTLQSGSSRTDAGWPWSTRQHWEVAHGFEHQRRGVTQHANQGLDAKRLSGHSSAAERRAPTWMRTAT